MFINDLVKNIPREFVIAISAGCEIEHVYNKEKGTYQIKTKNKIGVHEAEDGTVDVYELKN